MAKRRETTGVTIRDVAAEAEVSLSTVSRALSGHPAISSATRERIVRAAQRLNYAGLAGQRTPPPFAPRSDRMVGVVIAALHNSFYTELLDHLHSEFQTLGYNVTLIVDPLLDSDDFSPFAPLLDGYLSGVVFTTATLRSPVVAELASRGVPLVLAVRSVDGIAIDTVEVDNVRAGEDAARHLIELGHREIGFVMGPTNTSTARDRYAGARNCLDRHGLLTPVAWSVWGNYTHENGYSGAIQMLNRSDRPSAIIGGNDTIALGILDAAHKIGMQVPGELSVIGFDDIAIAGWSFVSLTTLRQPINEMARLAARRLVNRIRNPEAPVNRDLLPTNLVQRDTTSPPPRHGQ